MAGVSIDASQLQALADDIRAGSRAVVKDARAAVNKGAVNIKNDWRREWAGLSHAPALAAAITYDVKVAGRGIEAEIGPDPSRRQGPLDNIIEFGTVNNAPHPGGAPALRREEPRFVKAAEDLIAGILK
jgi:hypothetical protein